MHNIMTNKKMQVLGSRSDDGYMAKLFEYRVDDCGNVTFDLIFKSRFVNGIHSETNLKNRFVSTQDKIKLNEKIVELIWNDLEKDNHWFCTIPTMKTCSVSSFFEYFNFFNRHQSFRSIEFYTLSCFLSHTYSPLRNRIEKYEKFENVIDYISYGHREKSIRFSLYQNYEVSVRWMKRYDPKADMIICRSFDDPNLICRLINTPVKYELFDGISLTYAIHFLRWLQKRYSPVSIVTSIESSTLRSGSVYTPMWVNTMLMVNRLSITSAYSFNKYFQKVKMNAKLLHDELMRINTLTRIEQTNNYIYPYTQEENQVETRIDRLQFKLVKSTLELYDWGDMLQNCLFGFNERIINKRCLIIGVYIEDALTYAVEFNGVTILQAYGKYNEDIPEDDMEYIRQWADQATECLKDCIYSDAFLSNPNAHAETEEQDDDYIDELLLDEFEEEKEC